jgi:putative DNA primase/helicase
MTWREVSKAASCPICGKPDWCGRSDEGAVRCMRITDPPAGWRVVKRNTDGGIVFRRDDESLPQSARSSGPKPAPKPAKSAKTWPTLDAAIAAAARSTGGKHVQTWTYEHGDATDAFHVARFNLADGSKQFRPVHLNCTGFVLGDPPGMLPLYRLPDLQGTARVWVTEGEKAADAARSIGLIATTSAHGSKSAAKTDWRPLAGKDVVILPDADDAGDHYAATVAAILHRLGCSVRIVRLPDLPDGGDIFDYIKARECVEPETIRAGIEALTEAALEWEPLSLHNRDETRKSEPIIVRLADVKPEPLRWLWPGRIALGKLTMIAGDPGLGKSFLTLDIASRLSTGTPWPDAVGQENPSGGAVLLSAEDDIADTIRPRLDAAGADVARIIALRAVQQGEGAARMFNLATDLSALDAAIQRCTGCRLVVVDPITAYLGKTDSHKNADIRGLLAPLSDLAARHGIAIVAVSHLNKSGAGPAMYRTMGSLAFVAAARAAWAVVRDPDDNARRLLLPVKNNLAPDAGGLAYSLRDSALDGIPSIAWESQPVSITADEVLSIPGGGDERTGREDAAEWLRVALADGPMKATDVKRQAKQNSIAERTLNRAKTTAGVQTKREGFGPGATWYWLLPGHRLPLDPIDGQQKNVATYGEVGNLCSEPAEQGDAA